MILEREEGREKRREEGREKRREAGREKRLCERNINMLSLAHALTRDQTHNLDMCPEWEVLLCLGSVFSKL